MSLIASLKDVASKLGLIKVVTIADPTKPRKITTRTVTLKDLATDMRADEVRALAELPAELTVAFDQVFAAAGVKPLDHGWSVDKLYTLVTTEQYQQLPKDQAQRAILGMLSAEKASVEDIIKDAMARDKAIHAFGDFVQQKMQARKEVRALHKADLETQIQTLREQALRLDEETKTDEQQWRDWHQKKVAYEKQMAAALSYLLDKAVVTIDETTS